MLQPLQTFLHKLLVQRHLWNSQIGNNIAFSVYRTELLFEPLNCATWQVHHITHNSISGCVSFNFCHLYNNLNVVLFHNCCWAPFFGGRSLLADVLHTDVIQELCKLLVIVSADVQHEVSGSPFLLTSLLKHCFCWVCKPFLYQRFLHLSLWQESRQWTTGSPPPWTHIVHLRTNLLLPLVQVKHPWQRMQGYMTWRALHPWFQQLLQTKPLRLQRGREHHEVNDPCRRERWHWCAMRKIRCLLPPPPHLVI